LRKLGYGNIGPLNVADNGLIYDGEGVITGVEHPFTFTVDANCPNDHLIPFVLTVNYRNGFDPADPTNYVRQLTFSYPVQRGRDLPRVISTNLDLTATDYWLVGGPVLIEPGVTVTVRPGTTLQWGGISDDPYNPGPQKGNIIVRGSLLVEGPSTLTRK
jgi:hypothetical protein